MAREATNETAEEIGKARMYFHIRIDEWCVHVIHFTLQYTGCARWASQLADANTHDTSSRMGGGRQQRRDNIHA